MKKIIVVGILIVVGYIAWRKFKPSTAAASGKLDLNSFFNTP